MVAEDPVPNGQLPGNIADVTRAIIRAAERESAETLREQVDYALRLNGNNADHIFEDFQKDSFPDCVIRDGRCGGRRSRPLPD